MKVRKTSDITSRSLQAEGADEPAFFDHGLALGFLAPEAVEAQGARGHIEFCAHEAMTPVGVHEIGLFEEAHGACLAGAAE